MGTKVRTLVVSQLPKVPMSDISANESGQILHCISILQRDIIRWGRDKLLPPASSYAFVVCKPTHNRLPAVMEYDWDKPETFVWVVAGCGIDADDHIARAVLMLRPALRTMQDTLKLRLHSVRNSDFYNEVDGIRLDDGTYNWGDLARGGATFTYTAGWVIPCSVDGFPQETNDMLAKTLGARVGWVLAVNRIHPSLR